MKVHLPALILLHVLVAQECSAITLGDLQLSPPAAPTNVLLVQLDAGILGSDQTTTQLTGNLSVELELRQSSNGIVPFFFEFNGGSIAVADATLELLGGIITGSLVGVAATPSTPQPPSFIQDNQFSASDHIITINQGTASFPGTTLDFALNPIDVPGTGTGTFGLSVISLTPTSATLEASITVPVSATQMFVIPNVPLVGDVDATLDLTGAPDATQQFTVSLVSGDFNVDGLLNCEDLGILESAVESPNPDAIYDVNDDGLVNDDDTIAWITLAGVTPGDANIDGIVDGLDFIVWNRNKFATGKSWCEADFNHDDLTDGLDFLTWNANKFQVTPSAVPEPAGQMLLAYAGWVCVVVGSYRSELHVVRRRLANNTAPARPSRQVVGSGTAA